MIPQIQSSFFKIETSLDQIIHETEIKLQKNFSKNPDINGATNEKNFQFNEKFGHQITQFMEKTITSQIKMKEEFMNQQFSEQYRLKEDQINKMVEELKLKDSEIQQLKIIQTQQQQEILKKKKEEDQNKDKLLLEEQIKEIDKKLKNQCFNNEFLKFLNSQLENKNQEQNKNFEKQKIQLKQQIINMDYQLQNKNDEILQQQKQIKGYQNEKNKLEEKLKNSDNLLHQQVMNNIFCQNRELEDLLNKIVKIDKTIDAIKKNLKNITYEIITQACLKQGEYVTNCSICNQTCHYPCGYPDTDDKKKCSAMKDGFCTECPKNCYWRNHQSDSFRYLPEQLKKEIITTDDSKNEQITKLQGDKKRNILKSKQLICQLTKQVKILDHTQQEMTEIDFIDNMIVKYTEEKKQVLNEFKKEWNEI